MHKKLLKICTVITICFIVLSACKKDDNPKGGSMPPTPIDTVGSVTFHQTTWNFPCYSLSSGQIVTVNIQQRIRLSYKLTEAMNGIYFDQKYMIYTPETFDSLSPGTYYFNATNYLVNTTSVCDSTFTGSTTISEFDIIAGQNTDVIVP